MWAFSDAIASIVFRTPNAESLETGIDLSKDFITKNRGKLEFVKGNLEGESWGDSPDIAESVSIIMHSGVPHLPSVVVPDKGGVFIMVNFKLSALRFTQWLLPIPFSYIFHTYWQGALA